MKARAFVLGFVVVLFWLAPSPSSSQARVSKRESAKTMPTHVPTALPAAYAK